MADRYRGVPVAADKKACQRLTDNIAPPNDDGVRARRGYLHLIKKD
jgi:hypothetical protein